MEKIQLNEALRRVISEQHNKPIISRHEIILILYKLYQDKCFNGATINRISLDEPEFRNIESNIRFLEEIKLIKQDLNLPLYFITEKERPSAQQVICTMNPYSYIAYLSAMEFYGLTERIPYNIHLVTGTSAMYKRFITDKINKTLTNVINIQPLIPPRLIKYPSFDKTSFSFHQTKDFKLPKEKIGTGGVRVSALGDTFLDMIKKPDLCGGIEHVIDVYMEYAEEYLPSIVKSINKNGTAIDKARSGYILEELCHLSHKTINTWKSGVSRGGSRKLVPSNPYKDVYSETWCISINL